ncbi:unnamed protein product [Clonostachys rosea f. rosea IK726]|uniref:FAD/NAD(P)-binding domain-containing protein n=2 Tax=Bionectria ochroleuca TaxID=29856 RepID=A0A0B7K2B7_BIOOC|nr:unnamed protein product [Clonostachys rosea f. rosea IK726]
MEDSSTTSFDVVIVGAGMSGINAAYRVQNETSAGTNYIILEGRDALGGTWDLFRYPGLRSDSDMFTFGLPWDPWNQARSMASGQDIKTYMSEAAQKTGIASKIRYGHTVTAASWKSKTMCWELEVSVVGKDEPIVFKTKFALLGTGYYDYATPLQAHIPGIENFGGQVIHPQFWPKDYDFSGKNIVIIGSGATAVTLVPSVADKAERVTMLQRSPTYILPLSDTHFIISLLFTVLPKSVASSVLWFVYLLGSVLSNLVCELSPGLAKHFIKAVTLRQLPPEIKWDPHFKPRYNPWEQRFCACRNGDFFTALRSGKANVVTDRIKEITKGSIELESGASLQPDVIVTATGLKLKFGGGIRFSIDGQPCSLNEKFAWKAVMVQDVPNVFFLTGFQNASWTLGADISVRIFVRLGHLMERRNARAIVPRVPNEKAMKEQPMMSLSSTYVKPIRQVFPKAGTGIWAPKTNYYVDMWRAKRGDVTTDLEFL